MGARFQPITANGIRTAIEMPVRTMTSSIDILFVMGSYTDPVGGPMGTGGGTCPGTWPYGACG